MEDYKAKTMESYNVHAEYFSEYFKDLTDLSRRPEFRKFFSLLNTKARILDLGCGGGDHSVWFKEQGFDVVAIDLSEKMIEIARGKKVDARLMDIESLDFNDNEFEGIWAVTSLLHVPKRKIREVIEKLSVILKKDGLLYVCVKEGEGERFVVDKNDESTGRFFAFWKKDELLGYFKDKFELKEFGRINSNNTTFLEFFFKNKKLS